MSRFDANPDLVIDMEAAGVGVEEILQYAYGVLARDEVRSLIQGLTEVVEANAPVEEEEVEISASRP